MTGGIRMSKLSILFLLLAIITGCTPSPIATPTEPILVDAFFSGEALLDANGNGQIDSEDTPIANATFIVALQGGGEFGDSTDEAGNAFVTVPGGVEYPMTVRMEAPKDSTLKLIEPSIITLSEATGEATKFLFSSK
jgi:hypothetical protein